MTNTDRILAFAGSTRSASLNKSLIQAAAVEARNRGAEVTVIDLGAFPMPLYDGDLEAAEGIPENALALRRLMQDHPAWLIATPEYNGFFPALLKNAIDWVSRPLPGEPPLAAFKGHTAALLSASPGPSGGARALVKLREQLQAIGVSVSEQQFSLAKAHGAFALDGSLALPEHRKAVEEVSCALVRNARAAAA